MRPQTTLSETTRLVIPFHDLDPMDICWHGNYVKYLEMARNAMWRKIDYDFAEMRDSGYVYPVIELFIRYAQPLRYLQQVDVTASLVEWENRMKVDYVFHDAETGRRLTRAHTVQVAVSMKNGEMCFATPSFWKEKLKGYLVEGD
jgi:acyl-CoA thioester hydrolase